MMWENHCELTSVGFRVTLYCRKLKENRIDAFIIGDSRGSKQDILYHTILCTYY